MTKHSCEDYGTFEDWFDGHFDADEVRTLREYGADAGVGELTYYGDIHALFERFSSEIESIAVDAYGGEIWEIVSQRKIGSVSELITALVHIAAEYLATVWQPPPVEDDEEPDSDIDDDSEEEATS